MNNNSFDTLIKLHKVEKRLLEINHSRGDLPGKIEVIKNKINNLNSQSQLHNDRLTEIDRRKTLLTHTIQDIESKVSSLNDQMYKVKSNREYEALLSEIDHLNNENLNTIKELEEFDDEIKKIESSLNENNESLELLNNDLSNKDNQLKETNSEFEKEEKKLVDEKNSFIDNLSEVAESLIHTYNSKKEEYDGLAFSAISRGCCENCYSQLPPQLIIDAKNKEQLVNCPSCNILLYSQEDDSV